MADYGGIYDTDSDTHSLPDPETFEMEVTIIHEVIYVIWYSTHRICVLFVSALNQPWKFGFVVDTSSIIDASKGGWNTILVAQIAGN